MKKYSILLLITFAFACTPQKKQELNQEILASLGSKYKIEFSELVHLYESQLKNDSTNVKAYIGLAESHILLYVFGYIPRNETVTKAKIAYEKVWQLDSLSSDVVKLSGIISFLDWQWEEARLAFEKSIKINPQNLNARHWYALWLLAMGNFEEAMAQSDTIMAMDSTNDYLISRASFLYFQYRFEEMKPLMYKSIEKDSIAPWAYDWLGMAYNGLSEHKDALKTYFKAFELSDGTVEIGAGLGHALGNAGETDLAKHIANYYSKAAKNNYLPPVQRSFVHLGLKEYDEAISLLEQAYLEKSWFLIFMQIEHWYDPIRNDIRFINIMNRMEFPYETKNKGVYTIQK